MVAAADTRSAAPRANIGHERTPVFGSSALRRFPAAPHTRKDFEDPAVLHDFLKLDDHDIMGAVKVWADHPGQRARAPCGKDLVERRTYRIRLLDKPRSWSASHASKKPWRKSSVYRLRSATISCSPTAS